GGGGMPGVCGSPPGVCNWDIDSKCGRTSCCQSDPAHDQDCCGTSTPAGKTFFYTRYCTGPGACPGGEGYPNFFGLPASPPHSWPCVQANGLSACCNDCDGTVPAACQTNADCVNAGCANCLCSDGRCGKLVGPKGCSVCTASAYSTSCNASWNGNA